MSSKPNSSIKERLQAAHLVIANSLAETEIQSLVVKYGYPATELQNGMTLFEQASLADEAQAVAASAQQVATDASLEAETAARRAYQSLAKVARAVYQSDKARLVALELNRAEPVRNAAFIATAKALFDNAAGTPSLSGHGYDTAELAAGRALITAFELADEKQEAAKGISQLAPDLVCRGQATQQRDVLLEKLDACRLAPSCVLAARTVARAQGPRAERVGVCEDRARRTARPAAIARTDWRAGTDVKDGCTAGSR